MAARVGLDMPREALTDAAARSGADLYGLLARVADHYAALLARDVRAQQYLERRGVNADSVRRFQLGYAAHSWNDVLRRFGGDDAARRALSEAGLIVERDTSFRDAERYYDRFRDRLMFPIRDARGRVIAFGGRVIDQGEPKYLNSPETILFHKGRELYGLYEARRARVPLKRLLVVEGYLDVVRLHQFGIVNAVATLGTATTAEHLKRLFRLVNEIVFAFDGDAAGRAAAWRALQNALPEARDGRELKFLFLPEGEDPDSLLGTEGATAFQARIDSALPLSEYLVRTLSAQFDVGHADGRARLAAAAKPLLAKLPEGVYRDLLLERLAAQIGLSAARLRQLWQTPAAPAPPPTRPFGVQPFGGRRRPVGGRGGLVTQAVR
ncbi:MAG: DNA primase, partial [Steroidobacteraceae bacterium]|nr:DNA primase [Steroidobacteraceae bacterium]